MKAIIEPLNNLLLWHIAVYSVLYIAVILLWIPEKKRLIPVWLVLLAIILGLIANILAPIALIPIAIFAACAYISQSHDNKFIYRLLSGFVVLAVGYGLVDHKFPGFNNWLVLDNVQISADGIPFTLYLNFDKTLVGLFILGYGHQLLQTKQAWIQMFRQLLLRLFPVLIIILALSYVLAYVQFDPKLPGSFFIWAITNLLFVCLAEEAFFRGFIQKYLTAGLKQYFGGNWIAIIIAAILFGLLHYAGGPKYIFLASVAGVGYGWIYNRTGRIEASILCHFTLNTIHFLFFTYPALISAFI